MLYNFSVEEDKITGILKKHDINALKTYIGNRGLVRVIIEKLQKYLHHIVYYNVTEIIPAQSIRFMKYIFNVIKLIPTRQLVRNVIHAGKILILRFLYRKHMKMIREELSSVDSYTYDVFKVYRFLKERNLHTNLPKEFYCKCASKFCCAFSIKEFYDIYTLVKVNINHMLVSFLCEKQYKKYTFFLGLCQKTPTLAAELAQICRTSHFNCGAIFMYGKIFNDIPADMDVIKKYVGHDISCLVRRRKHENTFQPKINTRLFTLFSRQDIIDMFQANITKNMKYPPVHIYEQILNICPGYVTEEIIGFKNTPKKSIWHGKPFTGFFDVIIV